MIIERKMTKSECSSQAVGDGGVTAYGPCLHFSGRDHLVKALIVFLVILILSPAARAEQSISVNDITIGPATADDFVAGRIYVQAQPIFWHSDEPWRITVRSVQPNLGVSDDGAYVKLLGDLMWKLSDDVTWTPVTQEENEVDYGTEPGEGAIYVDFVLTLDWLKDIAGNYGAELVFTIGAVE